jgi:hypothetical protein
VQQPPRGVVAAQLLVPRLHHDHVVELEALHLLDLGDLDAGGEAEVLLAHPMHAGHLALHEAGVVDVAHRGRGRQHRHRGERLLAREARSASARKATLGARVGELEHLDGRARARGDHRALLALVAEQRQRELGDLARRAVAHLERVDLGALEAEVSE